MNKERLTAFSDGVIAIIITIMVLELKPPREPSWQALAAVAPVLSSYILSFLYIAIYWNNHHHLLHMSRQVNGAILWANMHLLFWLSLIPFATAWLGENPSSVVPTILYGTALLLPSIAYFILQGTIVRANGDDTALARALGKDIKGKTSLFLYIAAIAAAAFMPWLSQLVYVTVALMWLVPDRRIERALKERPR
jgi:uncharacterized membrane protein